MIDYKASVLRNYAAGLYTLSYLVALVGALSGLVVGSLLTGFYSSAIAGPYESDMTGSYIIIGLSACLGLLIGLLISFNLRVKAQTILCQVAIEENTRNPIRTVNRQAIS